MKNKNKSKRKNVKKCLVRYFIKMKEKFSLPTNMHIDLGGKR
jgi:hypothetical protein